MSDVTIDDVVDEMVYHYDEDERTEAEAIVKKALSGDVGAIIEILQWVASAEKERCQEMRMEDMSCMGYC